MFYIKLKLSVILAQKYWFFITFDLISDLMQQKNDIVSAS